MPDIAWLPLLGWATVIALACAVVIVVGLLAASDALLSDYPPELQERYRELHGEQSRRGRIVDAVLGTLMAVLALGLGVLALADLAPGTGRTGDFITGVLLGLGAGVLLVVIDTVVIDWGIFCRLQPGFVVLPGTEGDPAYADYWFQVRVMWPGITVLLAAIGVGYGLLALAVTELGKAIG
ncbi:hypothetical protein [Nocardioides sp. AE5]|uniref:hypothetical protein n=1 Tax=Nocardioides sp. AE5 TaxID=2962573 RepID=UPI002882B3DB|nr:hypothetical protein [Nocardioides sp. AE5]MDT0201051.1 hypothetical protein [Nocardioides sp. AE5]